MQNNSNVISFSRHSRKQRLDGAVVCAGNALMALQDAVQELAELILASADYEQTPEEFLEAVHNILSGGALGAAIVDAQDECDLARVTGKRLARGRR